jgi:hypothetical protein
MAETVKRRVAAARLAVAFVAAGTIAGASAWASADTPPAARESALNAYSKVKLDSSDIKNGSLLLQDFKSGEVLSSDAFVKYKKSIASFKSEVEADTATIKGELGDVKLQIGDIKGELGGYVKSSEADARYIKLSDSVVRGDGSVFTGSTVVSPQETALIMTIPGFVKIEALGGKPQFLQITNESSGPITFSTCGEGANQAWGVRQPDQKILCQSSGITQSIQILGAGADPTITTLSFSGLAVGQTGDVEILAQILIGL